MTSDQMTAFDAIAHFGARFGHLGKLGSMMIDTYGFNTEIEISFTKKIDGVEYKRSDKVSLKALPENEHIDVVDKGTYTIHSVHKLYGKIKIYASFIDDKKEESHE
jgi:hypothetical protein